MDSIAVSIPSSKSPVVAQSNQLTEARYSLTVAEQRLVLTLLSLISPSDKSLKSYEIKISEFQRLLDIKTNAIYDQVKDVLKKLASRVIYIPEGKDYLIANWFSSAKYDSKKGSVTISFDDNLKPYLLELKEQFTKYKLFVIAQFKSSYTIRIYMLLKQYEVIGFREIELVEIRGILDIKDNEYPRFADFRKRVLDQAKKEFETKNKESGGYMSDITFELETIRTGRKITRLRFNIRKQSYQERLPIELPETEVKEVSTSPAREALEKYGVKGKTAETYLDQQEESEILRCVALLEQAIGAGKVKSSESGYLLKLLEARAGQETEADRQRREKQARKEEQYRKATEEEQQRETENRLSNEFFRQERKTWLDSLSDDEQQAMLKAAKESMSGFSGSMVKSLESPLIMDFVKSQIADYDTRKAAYIKENMK